ncbi:hypothetical protein F5B21DRAFT_466465 [Xylaria acuta]|nr:hypothetical protein F5B21DRAFT_466465 [Xylaria acuta]
MRDLQKDLPPKNTIKTYNFVTGSQSYIGKASRRFLFGKSSVIDPAHLLTNIQSIPQDR